MKHLFWILICFFSRADHRIFFDGFETGKLDPAYWRVNAEGGEGTGRYVKPLVGVEDVPVAYQGRYAVVMGSDRNESYVNHLDLHLDLSGYRNVALEFVIRDFYDKTNLDDGLWFSDDDGATFKKAMGFTPTNWEQEYGGFPPIDIDEIARTIGIRLTSRFVIRFTQIGDQRTPSDGFAIDNVHVYEPEIAWARPPFHDAFETGTLGPSWRWAWSEDNDLVSHAGLVQVEPGNMEGSYLVAIGNRYLASSANCLDLHLDLAGIERVTLQFMIRAWAEAFHLADGLWASDDGGSHFVKLYPLKPEFIDAWNGKTAPIDLTRLAREKGLALTDRFILRFQQYDRGKLYGTSWDGFRIDDVSVNAEPITYVVPPFEDGFESGRFSAAWAWRDATLTSEPGTVRNSGEVAVDNLVSRRSVARTGAYGVRMGKSAGDRIDTTNALDLHLALANFRDVTLSMWLKPLGYETENATEGFYFSDDGGESFIPARFLRFDDWQRGTWARIELNIDALAAERGLSLTDTFVIRLQQISRSVFEDDAGVFLDDVALTGKRIPDTLHPVVTIPWLVNNSGFSSTVAIFNSGFSSANVSLLAVARDGRNQLVDTTISGRSLLRFAAADYFPGFNGFSIHVRANVPTLHCSFLTFNLEPVSGGHSPSQTVARPMAELTDTLLFGYVPGAETAALVMTAPEIVAGSTEVDLFLFGEGENPLETTSVLLDGNRPLAVLVADLFSRVPDHAAVKAATRDGTLITGTTFVFNNLRQPSMASATPVTR